MLKASVYSIVFLAATLAGPATDVWATHCALSDVVRQFAHRETLIASMCYSLDVTRFPTEPEQKAKIREFLETVDPDAPPGTLVITAETAQQQCRTIHHWQRGDLRRWETQWRFRDGDSAKEGETSAYDGQMLRQLVWNTEEQRQVGTIHAHGSGPADGQLARQPALFSQILGFHNRPFSAWLREDSKASVQPAAQPGVCTVTFRALRFGIELTIDEARFDIVRIRESGGGLYDQSATRTLMESELTEFAEVTDISGESIRYPRRASITYFVGQLPSGELVSNCREEYRIKNAEFNVPIEDERFTLSFPPGIKMFDGVNGLGWIEQGPASPAPVPLRAATKKAAWNLWWGALGLGNAALVGVIGWLLWRRREA